MGAFDWLTGGVNKRMKGLSEPLQGYSGYRPPRVTHLRPVEDQITNILMERSKGIGVGYDPQRREELLQNFDIEQGRDMEETRADLQNRISGMGLSRNAAVYDELLGRANREAGREKNLYRNRVDIEDLAKRNEERDVNTARLQDLNTFNFGQENTAANFDLDVFSRETGNELARRGVALGTEAYRESPLSVGLAVADAASNFMPGTSGKTDSSKPVTPTYQSPTGRYQSPNDSYGSGRARQEYLNNMARRSGYNFDF